MKEKVGRQSRKRAGKGLLAIMGAVLLLAGCGAAGQDQSAPEMPGAGGASKYTNSAYDAQPDMMAADMSYEEVWTEEEFSSQGGVDTGAQMDGLAQPSDRKLIKTVDMEVETKAFDELLSSLESTIKSLGGYIESRNTYNGSSYTSYRSSRSADLVIRIPKEELDAFLNAVSEAGNVTRYSDNVEDVTLTYVDLESHRNALRTEQDRLLELLERAESLEDILTIESRLSELRYQLESMESRLRTFDNQVDYSTVRMDISEVRELTPVAEKTDLERIREGFMESLKEIVDGVKEAMIWFLAHLPYVILWGLVILLLVFWFRRRRKKKAAEAGSPQKWERPQAADQETKADESKLD